MTRSYAILSSLNVICITFTIDRVVAAFILLQNVNAKNSTQCPNAKSLSRMFERTASSRSLERSPHLYYESKRLKRILIRVLICPNRNDRSYLSVYSSMWA